MGARATCTHSSLKVWSCFKESAICLLYILILFLLFHPTLSSLPSLCPSSPGALRATHPIPALSAAPPHCASKAGTLITSLSRLCHTTAFGKSVRAPHAQLSKRLRLLLRVRRRRGSGGAEGANEGFLPLRPAEGVVPVYAEEWHA